MRNYPKNIIQDFCLGLAPALLWPHAKHLASCSGADWCVCSTLTVNTDWQLCIWRTCGQLLIKADRVRTQCRGSAAALMPGCCVAPSSCGCHYWRNLCIKGQLCFSLFSVFVKAEPVFSLRMKVLFHVLFCTTEHRSWMIYFFLLISIFFFVCFWLLYVLIFYWFGSTSCAGFSSPPFALLKSNIIFVWSSNQFYVPYLWLSVIIIYHKMGKEICVLPNVGLVLRSWNVKSIKSRWC